MICIRLLIVTSSLLLFVRCATTPPPEPKPTGRLGAYSSSPDDLGQYNKIDYEFLAKELKISLDSTKVGYTELPFDACQIKANISNNPACDQLYFGILHFQMVCRTNDAIVKRNEMKPLTAENIQWKQGYLRGLVTTNKNGFGSIMFIANSSSKFQPMIMRMKERVIFKRLQDQWQMILPYHWCKGNEAG